MSTELTKETLLNEIESARFLKVSRMTVIRKRKAGDISHYRIGFRVLYSLEKHLLPFLAKCEKSGDVVTANEDPIDE